MHSYEKRNDLKLCWTVPGDIKPDWNAQEEGKLEWTGVLFRNNALFYSLLFGMQLKSVGEIHKTLLQEFVSL